MRPYDKNLPLFSLHIPKCAGQSFRRVLETWFADRFYTHYFQQNNAPPPTHSVGPGSCVHGHFNRTRGFGVLDYYPEAEQFITVMRNPLEAAISNYFYWKSKARANQLRNGVITEGGYHDYRDIDDFFLKRPKSNMLDFFPWGLTLENYRDYLRNSFAWIGLVEDLQKCVFHLAKVLDFPPVTIDQINVSSWTAEPSLESRRAFIEHNSLEFEIYEYVRQSLSQGSL